MSISPPVFLAYGRPDRSHAHQLASRLWANQIECYNYMIKPYEDRAVSEVPHHTYIYTCKYFIGLVSKSVAEREPVTREFDLADWRASVDHHSSYKRAFVMISASEEERFTIAVRRNPDVTVVWGASDTPDDVYRRLIAPIDLAELADWQEKWKTNRGLYPQAWRELDERYGNEYSPESFEQLPRQPFA